MGARPNFGEGVFMFDEVKAPQEFEFLPDTPEDDEAIDDEFEETEDEEEEDEDLEDDSDDSDEDE